MALSFQPCKQNRAYHIFFRIETLERDGVRFIYRENNTFANDAEPEYIAYNSDETKAYIGLQVGFSCPCDGPTVADYLCLGKFSLKNVFDPSS